jgi:hypothetical protein
MLVSEPRFNMEDQRFDRTKELGSVLEERLTKRMEEILAALAIKLQPL